jgi:hypothetical protein
MDVDSFKFHHFQEILSIWRQIHNINYRHTTQLLTHLPTDRTPTPPHSHTHPVPIQIQWDFLFYGFQQSNLSQRPCLSSLVLTSRSSIGKKKDARLRQFNKMEICVREDRILAGSRCKDSLNPMSKLPVRNSLWDRVHNKHAQCGQNILQCWDYSPCSLDYWLLSFEALQKHLNFCCRTRERSKHWRWFQIWTQKYTYMYGTAHSSVKLLRHC